MSSDYRESMCPPRERLVGWLSRLYSHRLTTTTGGNLSLLDDDGTLYITPSGGDKAIVPPEKVAVRRVGQTTFEGPCPPSMEHPLHTAAYQVRPNECQAVLHAHSLTLVAFSMAAAPVVNNDFNTQGKEDNGGNNSEALDNDPRLPDTRCLLGAWQTCGTVALAPYALPGSQELADGCRKALEQGADCVILQNHGVVVIGKTMHQAYDRFVSLEYLARSIVHSVPLQVAPVPLEERFLQFALQEPDDCEEMTAVESAKRRKLTSNGSGKQKHLKGSTSNNSKKTMNPFPTAVPPCPQEDNCYHKSRVMTGDEKTERARLCDFVKRAYRQDLVTSSSGSFSTRCLQVLDDNAPDSTGANPSIKFLITPTGVDRLSLEPSDLCLVANSDKNNLGSSTSLWHHPVHKVDSPEYVEPSRAAKVHATIYAKHPEIHCVMVVQPPYATAYCITGRPFDSAGIPESHMVLHHVETLPLNAVLERDGQDLANALDPANGRTTILVQGYGLVTVGKDLLKTFVQVEVCESMCGVTLTAIRRGPVAMLSKNQVEEINQFFQSSH